MKIELRELSWLKPYEKNVKKHEPEQVAQIAAAIKLTGWDQPIVADKDGVIIKGHGRRLAAISMGMTHVPVLVRDDLTPDQVRAARLADNRVALSGFDTEMLRDELRDLAPMLENVFPAKELEFTMADLGTMVEDPFVPDVDAAVSEQEQEAKEKADATAARRVPIAKVLGFKDIAGANELVFTRFLAKAEADSGLTGEAAVVAALKKLAV